MRTSLAQNVTLPLKLRRAVYGTIAGSKAVQAVETYHGYLSDGWERPEDLFEEIIQYFQKLDNLPDDCDSIAVGAENVNETFASREVVRPLREALCRGDGQFFKDLGEAIDKRKNTPHRDALAAHDYVSGQALRIMRGERDLMTRSEVKKHLEKAGIYRPNVSRILKDELGIDIKSSGLFRTEKPGRKSLKKAN